MGKNPIVGLRFYSQTRVKGTIEVCRRKRQQVIALASYIPNVASHRSDKNDILFKEYILFKYYCILICKRITLNGLLFL